MRWEEAAAAGVDHQRIEAQNEIQGAFKRMSGSMADMFKIVSLDSGGVSPDAVTDDMARRLMGLEGGGKGEGARGRPPEPGRGRGLKNTGRR
ncbi:MAG: hypothetical protein J4F28_07140 [Nitrosopumilaceae archaeon]|nr:hypothetical protein [Nitrosopumilaceae archaeon]